MLPYNPYLYFAIGLILTLIPIATTWPGIEPPPIVGLLFALVTAAGVYTLKNMAPAHDVHKDSELPPPPVYPTAEEVAREQIRILREERTKGRLPEKEG